MNPHTSMKPKKRPSRMPLIAILLTLFALSPTFRADDAELPEEVQKLNESYAREIARVLPPIQEKYLEALERILESYTRAGSFDQALQTKKQIESAMRWENLPLPQSRGEKKEDWGRSEFKDWLKTKSFSFRGVSSVTLEFDDRKVRWIAGGAPREHDFRVSGKRGVIVEGGQNFRLEFADDLSTGTFESNVGKYPLTIVDRE